MRTLLHVGQNGSRPLRGSNRRAQIISWKGGREDVSVVTDVGRALAESDTDRTVNSFRG